MKALKRVVLIALLTPIALFLAIYALEWSFRAEATRVLSIVKPMRLGVTTQSEYLASLSPYIWINHNIASDSGPLKGAFEIGSHPVWYEIYVVPVLYRIFGDHIPDWTLFEGTDFGVIPEFQDGFLVSLELDMSGNVTGHPPGIWVRAHSAHSRERFLSDPSSFSGYFFNDMSMHRDAQRRPIPWEFFVELDDRATQEERSRAFDLRFDCFTRVHACDRASQFGNPVQLRPRDLP